MKDGTIIRDERTRTVEDASYRIGFNILCFGVMLDIIFRSIFFKEAPWDLFALVIVGSWASTIYQGTHKTLPPHFLRSMLILVGLTALLSAVMVFVIVGLRR
jgi:hypothetical protein